MPWVSAAQRVAFGKHHVLVRTAYPLMVLSALRRPYSKTDSLSIQMRCACSNEGAPLYLLVHAECMSAEPGALIGRGRQHTLSRSLYPEQAAPRDKQCCGMEKSPYHRDMNMLRLDSFPHSIT